MADYEQMIKELDTLTLSDLNRKIQKELSLRTEKSSMSILNEWAQAGSGRKFEFSYSEVNGHFVDMLVIEDDKELFEVSSTTNEKNYSQRKTRGELATKALKKLGIKT